jgi:hypothetical protein
MATSAFALVAFMTDSYAARLLLMTDFCLLFSSPLTPHFSRPLKPYFLQNELNLTQRIKGLPDIQAVVLLC